MLRTRVKKLALCFVAGAAFASPQAHAENLTIAVASSFAKAASDLAASFQAYYANYGLSYNVAITSAPAQTLKETIIAEGASPTYDLFLSSSKNEPHELAFDHPSLVVGTPFKYAKDFLALYSKSVDIHTGLPYTLDANFVIPDPTTDVYGAAAAEVLSSHPWYVNSTTIPSGHVFTAATAGSAFAAVDRGLYAYGFVARSAICYQNAEGVKTFPASSYHHIYRPNDEYHPSDKLIMKGIKIARTRTAAEETALSNFIAFLTAEADSNGNTTTIGTGVIESFCFKSF